MKNLILFGLAGFGGYMLYQHFKNSGGDLPSPMDSSARAVASQPQQVSPIVSVMDPRQDNVNQTWYVGPREVLSTPLTDILNNLGLADSVNFSEEFSTAPLV